jgi:hypothetical protein
MEKLQLKHLAGYLPYELKIQNGKEFDIVTGVSKEIVESIFRGTYENTSMIKDVKPILHPLSDLTKSITIDGITFVPDTWISENIKTDVEIYQFLHGEISLEIITEDYNQTIDLMAGYLIIQKLNEWHFDWQGLIGKGLAIDINTLK